MGRHRHAVAVRTDGLAAVLGPLLGDPRIRSAALIDVDSGMVLDVCGPDTAAGRFGNGRAAEHDHRDEVRGAAHAELVRIGLALSPGSGGVLGLVLEAGPDRHVLHTVTDPHGGRLALSVVVRGSDRVLAKVRRQLRSVSEAALTAGPSVAVRPGSTAWSVSGPDAVPAGPAPSGPGGAGPADDEAAVATTTPHLPVTEPRVPPPPLPAPPAPVVSGPAAPLRVSAMLPAPRPEPSVPAAPADPVDPAPADR
jgi:hypothetical protein